MACEDYYENDLLGSVLMKGARRVALVLDSGPVRRSAGLLPRGLRAALAMVFVATARTLEA